MRRVQETEKQIIEQFYSDSAYLKDTIQLFELIDVITQRAQVVNNPDSIVMFIPQQFIQDRNAEVEALMRFLAKNGDRQHLLLLILFLQYLRGDYREFFFVVERERIQRGQSRDLDVFVINTNPQKTIGRLLENQKRKKVENIYDHIDTGIDRFIQKAFSNEIVYPIIDNVIRVATDDKKIQLKGKKKHDKDEISSDAQSTQLSEYVESVQQEMDEVTLKQLYQVKTPTYTKCIHYNARTEANMLQVLKKRNQYLDFLQHINQENDFPFVQSQYKFNELLLFDGQERTTLYDQPVRCMRYATFESAQFDQNVGFQFQNKCYNRFLNQNNTMNKADQPYLYHHGLYFNVMRMFFIHGLESESNYEGFYSDKNNVNEVTILKASFFNVFDKENIFQLIQKRTQETIKPMQFLQGAIRDKRNFIIMYDDEFENQSKGNAANNQKRIQHILYSVSHVLLKLINYSKMTGDEHIYNSILTQLSYITRITPLRTNVQFVSDRAFEIEKMRFVERQQKPQCFHRRVMEFNFRKQTQDVNDQYKSVYGQGAFDVRYFGVKDLGEFADDNQAYIQTNYTSADNLRECKMCGEVIQEVKVKKREFSEGYTFGSYDDFIAQHDLSLSKHMVRDIRQQYDNIINIFDLKYLSPQIISSKLEYFQLLSNVAEFLQGRNQDLFPMQNNSIKRFLLAVDQLQIYSDELYSELQKDPSKMRDIINNISCVLAAFIIIRMPGQHLHLVLHENARALTKAENSIDVNVKRYIKGVQLKNGKYIGQYPRLFQIILLIATRMVKSGTVVRAHREEEKILLIFQFIVTITRIILSSQNQMSLEKFEDQSEQLDQYQTKQITIDNVKATMVLKSSSGRLVQVNDKKPVIAIPNILLRTRMQAHHWMYIRFLRAQEVEARPNAKKGNKGRKTKVHCIGSTFIMDRQTRAKMRLGLKSDGTNNDIDDGYVGDYQIMERFLQDSDVLIKVLPYTQSRYQWKNDLESVYKSHSEIPLSLDGINGSNIVEHLDHMIVREVNGFLKDFDQFKSRVGQLQQSFSFFEGLGFFELETNDDYIHLSSLSQGRSGQAMLRRVLQKYGQVCTITDSNGDIIKINTYEQMNEKSMIKTLFIPSMKTVLLNFNKKRMVLVSPDYQRYEDLIVDALNIKTSETLLGIWQSVYGVLDSQDQRYHHVDIIHAGDYLCYNTHALFFVFIFSLRRYLAIMDDEQRGTIYQGLYQTLAEAYLLNDATLKGMTNYIEINYSSSLSQNLKNSHTQERLEEADADEFQEEDHAYDVADVAEEDS